jgi:hypothetical protein
MSHCRFAMCATVLRKTDPPEEDAEVVNMVSNRVRG